MDQQDATAAPLRRIAPLLALDQYSVDSIRDIPHSVRSAIGLVIALRQICRFSPPGYGGTYGLILFSGVSFDRKRLENDPISVPDIFNEPVVFLCMLNRMLISLVRFRV